ncbi:MAG: DUF3307 domain-containing protein [Flavobacteriaceae bacterium]|nr:DUF3307 domain-containing protein [Flavobacteriaceae bacterium]MDH3795634.1 DUF3307 domain-containing protein [Flavobacteriaceae bacterium]
MITFTKLLLAHLLGDFVFQPLRWVLHKEAHKIGSRYLYLHIAVHLLLTALLLWDLSLWKLIAWVVGSHYLIDLAKVYLQPLFKRKTLPFFMDQLAHILALYAIAYWTELPEHVFKLVDQLDWTLITTIVFVTYPAALIMNKLLDPLAHQIEFDHKSLPNAGKYIGMLERIFVLIFILLGRWEGIGLLITAKSVFRFNDLKESNNRKLTEYILIGTLLSFGIAILAGLTYMYFR